MPANERAIDAWAQPALEHFIEDVPEAARLFKQSHSSHLVESGISIDQMVASMDTSAHLPRYYPPQLIHFMKSYGREKVLFGTNFPQLPFEKCMEQVRALDLADEVRSAFLRENTLRVFKLG